MSYVECGCICVGTGTSVLLIKFLNHLIQRKVENLKTEIFEKEKLNCSV